MVPPGAGRSRSVPSKTHRNHATIIMPENEIWKFAEAVSGSRAEYEAGNALDSLLSRNNQIVAQSGDE